MQSSSLEPITWGGFAVEIADLLAGSDPQLIGVLDDRNRMRLTRSDRIVGLPAEQARTLLRQLYAPTPQGFIDKWADTADDQDDDRSLAQKLAADGWLMAHHVDEDGETWWQTTVRGNALAQASFGRPVSRATAQRHLEAVIARAKSFNADPAYLVDIVELVVFGSYLDVDAATLGDLDLAVSFRSRIPSDTDPEEQTRIQLDYARASGRTFNTFIDQLFWPEQQALLVLRNRSAVISITTEDIVTLTDRRQTVYRVD
ncbi:MAG: hypothetical protein JWN95_488 [Frankiales bacterium]|nr:hypothetical protein [Frankiales bacterium]